MPLTVFLPELRAFIEYGSASTCTDPSFIAVPMLAVLAGATGSAAEVELRAGWQEPCILWTAIIGASSTRKSPALRLVKEPLKRLQVRAQKEHERALAEYRRDLAEHEARKRSGKGDARATDAEPPRVPVLRRYFVSDITIRRSRPSSSRKREPLSFATSSRDGCAASISTRRGWRRRGAGSSCGPRMALSVERRTGEERSLFVERPGRR
jgi:hypothetical protein